MDKRKNIENIYAVRGMEEGMVFDWFVEKEGGGYMEESVFRIKGGVGAELFEERVECVMRGEDILRRVFLGDVGEVNGGGEVVVGEGELRV